MPVGGDERRGALLEDAPSERLDLRAVRTEQRAAVDLHEQAAPGDLGDEAVVVQHRLRAFGMGGDHTQALLDRALGHLEEQVQPCR